MANQAVLEKVLSDGAYVKELLAMETPEEVQASLNAKGGEVTVEEVKAIAKSMAQQSNGELSEDDLEDVAGGSVTVALIGLAGVAITALGGVATTLISTRTRW